MKWNLDRNITIGFSVAFLTLLAVSFISYQTLTNFHKTIEREKLSRNTLYELEDVVNTMKDVETGQWGYFITGKENYLKPYKNAVTGINKDLADLLKYVRDDRDRMLLDSLTYYTTEKINVAQKLIYIKDNSSSITIIKPELVERGKVAMDKIRQIANKLIAIENIRFQKESYNAEKSGDNTTTIIILGNAFALTFLILALLILNRDIKMRIETEDQLRTSKQISEDAKGIQEQFLANMSHEIRTPMNAIVGMTNLLLQTVLNIKQNQYVQAIKQSSHNLLSIINDILDFSKIKAGKIEFEIIDFRMEDIIQSLYSTFRFKMEEKNLEFIMKLDENLPKVVKGDPVRLTQILINLVGNSVKFTQKGFIEVECKQLSRLGDGVTIGFSVKDSGIGIKQDKVATIFESFFQATSDTSRKYGGTGLGLTITKQLIDLQKGTISVNSVIGEGTVFNFELPFEIGSEENIEDFSFDEINTEKLTGIAILLVEDNKFNQVVAVDSLTLLIKNVKIDIAEQGLQAIEMLKGNVYDIILMDVQMPELDGYETTKLIRKANEPFSNIPIMAITASATIEEVQKCLKSGMNDCITKPYDLLELTSKISALVKKDLYIEKQTLKIKAEVTKIINLDFIKNLTGNNEANILKYISMTLDSLPKSIENLRKHLDNKNYKELKNTAHMIKPGISYMGIEPAKPIIKDIENYADSETNLELLEDMVGEIEKILQLALLELKAEKSKFTAESVS